MQLLCLMKALSCQSDSYSHRAIFVVIACKHAQIIQHVQGFWSLSAPHCFQMTIEQIKRSLSLCTYLQYDVHNPWHVSMRVSLFQHRTPCWPVGRCSGILAFTAGVNILSFSCLMLWLSGWWLFQTLQNLVLDQYWQILFCPFFSFVDRTTMSVYKCSIQHCVITAPIKRYHRHSHKLYSVI